MPRTEHSITIGGETAAVATAAELVVALDVLQGQHDRMVLEQLAPHLVEIIADSSPVYSRRTSRVTRSFEKEPVSRTLPAENSVWVSVLAVKHTVPLIAQPRDQGCRSATASPLLWGARAAVHRE